MRLRVVSLLDVEVPWGPDLAKEMELDSFRASNFDDWFLVAKRLMEIAPILSIDAAAETDGVRLEMDYILESGLWRKCLFLLPPDGIAPYFDRLLLDAGLRRGDLRIMHYEHAPRGVAAMVAELKQRCLTGDPQEA